MIASYGDDNGFGWQLNEIVGAQIITVPADKVFETAKQLRYLVIGKILIILLAAVVLLNLFLKFTVTDPIKKNVSFVEETQYGRYGYGI